MIKSRDACTIVSWNDYSERLGRFYPTSLSLSLSHSLSLSYSFFVYTTFKYIDELEADVCFKAILWFFAMMRFSTVGLRIHNERKVKSAIVPLNLGVPIDLETAIVSHENVRKFICFKWQFWWNKYVLRSNSWCQRLLVSDWSLSVNFKAIGINLNDLLKCVLDFPVIHSVLYSAMINIQSFWSIFISFWNRFGFLFTSIHVSRILTCMNFQQGFLLRTYLDSINRSCHSVNALLRTKENIV